MSDTISLQIPGLLRYSDVALLLMRLLVGAVFVTSGWSHVKDPVTRGKSIGLPPGITRGLGLGEIAGGMGVAIGVLPQLAALGLILIMLGAIQKKIFVWHTGFLGKARDRWLALRPALRGDVPRRRHDRRRAVRPALIAASASPTRTVPGSAPTRAGGATRPA